MTRGRYRWALAVVAVSAFMTTMDNTVVFTALPKIMTDLDMSSSAKDWVATGYILMFSCLMITGGRLTDIYGCRVTFTTGMTVFTAASAVCGLAHGSEVLIIARIVQGGGAALALPATQVMVTVGRNDKQRSIGNIIFIGAASSATALGPTIGGVIVEHFHWGWIFLINIVPGILVILLGLVVLTGHGENRHSRIDLPGVIISATMLFAFIYGLEDGNNHGFGDPSVLSVFALGGIALVCFVIVEWWAPDPMIDLRFFRNRVFTGGLLSQMLYGIGFNGMMFYSQPFLQRFLGFSPPEAGLVMLPPAIAIMLLTPVAFLLATKLGPRPTIGFGMALMGLGMVLFSTLQSGDGYADLMPGVMLVGAGAALGMPLIMYVLKAVPEKRAGVASGVINVIREASGAFGIAIVGLLVHNVPDVGASAAALEDFRQGTSSGLVLGAVLVLVGGLISGVTLPSRRGWLGPKHGKQAPLHTAPAAALEAAAEPERVLVTATSPDPIPVHVPAPVAAPVGAAPPVPAHLPTEPDTMAAPPTPGPHWWSDTPDDDPAPAPTAWRPTPPDATSPWQDWADTAIPTWTAPEPLDDEPTWWTQADPAAPRPRTSKWFDDESAARSRGTLPLAGDPQSTLPDTWTPPAKSAPPDEPSPAPEPPAPEPSAPEPPAPLSAPVPADLDTPAPSGGTLVTTPLPGLAAPPENPPPDAADEPANDPIPDATAPPPAGSALDGGTPAPPQPAAPLDDLTPIARAAEATVRARAEAADESTDEAAETTPPQVGAPADAMPPIARAAEASVQEHNEASRTSEDEATDTAAPNTTTSQLSAPFDEMTPIARAVEASIQGHSKSGRASENEATDTAAPNTTTSQLSAPLNETTPIAHAAEASVQERSEASGTDADAPQGAQGAADGAEQDVVGGGVAEEGERRDVTADGEPTDATDGADGLGGDGAEGVDADSGVGEGGGVGGNGGGVGAGVVGGRGGGEPGDAWVAGRGGAEVSVPEVGEPGWPPPPPEGWLYAPYVPEDEEPSGESSGSPRGDAW